MELTLGRKYRYCIDAISQYGAQINTLADTLENLLKEEISSRKDIDVKLAEGKIYRDDRYDDSEWVYTDHTRSVPLVRKDRRKNKEPEQYLSFQVSLSGDTVSFSGNDEPLLHICLWEDKLDFEDFFMTYPMLDKESDYALESNRLIIWGERNKVWTDLSWTFSIRLFTLDSTEALRERVVAPVIKLLKGATATEALPDTLPGLVMYDDESPLSSR